MYCLRLSAGIGPSVPSSSFETVGESEVRSGPSAKTVLSDARIVPRLPITAARRNFSPSRTPGNSSVPPYVTRAPPPEPVNGTSSTPLICPKMCVCATISTLPT